MIGYLALLGAVLIWALSYIVMKVSATEFPHILFQFWRYAAVAVVFSVLFHRSIKGIPRTLWRVGLLQFGLANFVLGFFSIYAVQYTTPTRVVVINSLIIGFVPLLRWLHGRYKPVRAEKWAIAIALGGIALLLEPQDSALKLGDGLAFVGMVGYAYSIVITNRMLTVERASVIQVSFLAVAGCAVYFTLSAMVYAWVNPGGLALRLLLAQPVTVAGIFYMVVFVSLAANLLQVFGQRRLPPVTVSILFCLEPAVTAVLDYVLLDNASSFRVILCGILLVGATIITTLPFKEATKKGGVPAGSEQTGAGPPF